MTQFLKIYGERNSNTNYLRHLVALNLEVVQLRGVVPPFVSSMQNVLPGYEWLRDLYFRMTFGQNLGWKHAAVKSPQELDRYHRLRSKTAFVTITKNPYSWLLSLYRNPYHQRPKRTLSLEAFLAMPWNTVGRENSKRVLDSPVELWNIKNRSYLRLRGENCLGVTTEEIFRDARKVIETISERFSLGKKSEQFVDYEESTKNARGGREDYRRYYLTEAWRELLTPEARAIINDRVDRELMSHFGYQLIE